MASSDSTAIQLPLAIEGMTVDIPLTQGYTTVVDAIDADLAQSKWYASKSNRNIYAGRKNIEGKNCHMHREILGRKLGRDLSEGEYPDHADGDSLNNRRSNLRLATRLTNAMNRKLNANNASGYKGVSKFEHSWRCSIGAGNKHIFLGYYNTPEDAGIVYNHAALDLFGEFARVNDIPNWINRTPSQRVIRPTPKKSGITYILRDRSKWRASVWCRGKRINVGNFNTFEDAYAAQCALKRELGIE